MFWKLTSEHQCRGGLTLLLLIPRHALVLTSILDPNPPDGQGTSSWSHSPAGNHNLPVLEPVDVQYGEPIHGAVEHGGGSAVCHLGHGKQADCQGRGHLQHVLHLVLVHLHRTNSFQNSNIFHSTTIILTAYFRYSTTNLIKMTEKVVKYYRIGMTFALIRSLFNFIQKEN